ncbi:MAG: hypothetical protein CM1200mP28_15740 [Deltaproteobacteria bacterium]|nr:MAG: hypothetical protein CM1200mP28_15740 [Deltaproteobacteria bacterium]
MIIFREKKGKKVIKEIKEIYGGLVQKFGSGIRSRVVDASVSELIKEYLISVTQPGGTAELAAIKGYQVAGKTGPAKFLIISLGKIFQNSIHCLICWFCPCIRSTGNSSLFIVEQPQTSYYGGTVAAPIFNEIVIELYCLKSIAPAR